MPYSTHNTTKTVQRALKGEQQAFTELLNLYWKEVYHFILKKNSFNETEAEDVAIITFAKVFDKLEDYNSSYSFNTWLLTIAKNNYIDYLRKKNIQEVNHLDADQEISYSLIVDETPNIEDQLIHEQNLHTLKSKIKQLKPHYQQIIILRYFEDLSYKQIAEHINEPLTNVKVKLLRAKSNLIQLLKNKNS